MLNQPIPIMISLVGGLLSATLSLLHLFPVPGLILFSYLAPLPLFLIGLGIGLRPLYGAALIGTLITFIAEGPLLSAEFLISSVLGPILLSNRALLHRKTSAGKSEWYPSSFLLKDLTHVSALIMILGLGAYIYFSQGTDIHSLVKAFLKTIDPQGHLKNAETAILIMIPLLPGFFALSWALMMLINGALAQGLLIRFNHNLRPSPSLSDLFVPKSFLFVLGLSILLSFIGVGSLELLGKNASFVLTLPFFLVGLGVIHTWLKKSSYATFALTLFYFLLILFFWPIFFVIILGILKPWIEKPPGLN